MDELPRYYRRNFHFQTDGYLSEHSAELYEHQVEILFQGAADAMRRMLIAPMKNRLLSPDGAGLRLLEIGAGTGRATRFVQQAFPKARITCVDLSDAYLKAAQKQLRRSYRVDFVQADGAKLSFEDEPFDGVYSVFLFHELPLEERLAVLRESYRVLKPRGVVALVDSLQLNDRSDFESLLEKFPQDFHEPFYRNYTENPMEELLGQAQFKEIQNGHRFVSKWCLGQKI